MTIRNVVTLLFTLGGSLLAECQAQNSCLNDIQSIYDMESLVTDTSVHRTYTICSRRIFYIGNLDFNFDLQGFRVQPPLPIRPNMTIKCGESGSRENLCWIGEGDVQIDATPYRGISDSTVENVVIEGFVFINARRHALWATKPGSITFRDCEFRDFTRSVVPLLLDWYDGSDSQLTVTIEDSSFHDNRYFGAGSNTALIYANSNQNTLIIRRTTFENNDMTYNNTLASTNSFLIETLGSLTVQRLCFINNIVGVSDVAVFGNRFIDDDVFVSNSTGGLCGFAAVFENIQQFDSFSPLCVSSMANRCNSVTVPTQAPSASPTIMPTDIPSAIPTIAPTISASPSDAPSPQPSPAPSNPGDTPAPSRFHSEMPSVPPTSTILSAAPTFLAPSSEPTRAKMTKPPTPGFVFPTSEPDADPDALTGSFSYSNSYTLNWFCTIGMFALLQLQR